MSIILLFVFSQCCLFWCVGEEMHLKQVNAWAKPLQTQYYWCGEVHLMWIKMNLAAERKMSERQDASLKEWDNSGILSRPTGLLPVRHSAAWKPKSLCQSKRVAEPPDKHRHLPVKCLSRRRDCLSPAHCHRLFLLGKCVCLQAHGNQIPCVIDSVSAGTVKQQQHWGKLTEKRRSSEIRGINNHVCL